MSNIFDSFNKLLGRQATDAEIQKMYRVRDALDLKDNDALWVIAMTLQSYQTEFDKIPGAISKASVDALANIKSVADSAISASLLKAQMDMHAAAVSVFGGLADEAKAVVINAGRDIAAVDRANVEIALKRDNFKLLTASVAGAVVLSVAGFFWRTCG